jgi:hypothetical protein
LSESSVRAFSNTEADPAVRGFIHIPQNGNGSAIVLTHGAGSNSNAPLLVALAETFSEAGFTVLRCDLPYRQTRSFGPPGPGDAARDRAGLKNAIAAIKNSPGVPFLASFARSGDFNSNQRGARIFLGGHSYGGRQSSMLCAEEPEIVDGLLLLSYPLHPPRKPEQQRTQHLPDLRTPTLFVSGSRDPFGSIDELARAIKMIPGKTRLLPIEGAGHDLGFKGKAKQETLTKQILSEFEDFFS